MEADKLRAWGAKWSAIRDAAQMPRTRTYAENYLAMLRRQLTKLTEVSR